MMRPATSTRRIMLSALAALVSGFGIFALATGFDAIGLLRAVEVCSVVVLGGSIITGVIVLTLVHFANWQSPASEDDFEALVQRAERLAAEDPWRDDEYGDFGDTEEYDAVELDSEEDFKALVRSALDELPLEFHRALEHVAVVVSDRGAENHAYGMYVGVRQGGTFFGGGGLPDEILIFRDTLVRDFGDDPNQLRKHVTKTVRHEVGHHLGFDEAGVRKLGL
jgi:predicted Zn-dependent protease with MMP-like domain